jgi:hypothetical protein
MSLEGKLRVIRNGMFIVIGGAALAACSNGGGIAMMSPPPPPPPPPPPQEAFFGTAFATDFEANPNSTPAVPQATDIIAVSFTTEPQPVTFPSGH